MPSRATKPYSTSSDCQELPILMGPETVASEVQPWLLQHMAGACWTLHFTSQGSWLHSEQQHSLDYL